MIFIRAEVWSNKPVLLKDTPLLLAQQSPTNHEI